MRKLELKYNPDVPKLLLLNSYTPGTVIWSGTRDMAGLAFVGTKEILLWLLCSLANLGPRLTTLSMKGPLCRRLFRCLFDIGTWKQRQPQVQYQTENLRFKLRNFLWRFFRNSTRISSKASELNLSLAAGEYFAFAETSHLYKKNSWLEKKWQIKSWQASQPLLW